MNRKIIAIKIIELDPTRSRNEPTNERDNFAHWNSTEAVQTTEPSVALSRFGLVAQNPHKSRTTKKIFVFKPSTIKSTGCLWADVIVLVNFVLKP